MYDDYEITICGKQLTIKNTCVSHMDTVTISEYEEHVNKQLGVLKQLFQGFEGSSDVSYGK